MLSHGRNLTFRKSLSDCLLEVLLFGSALLRGVLSSFLVRPGFRGSPCWGDAEYTLFISFVKLFSLSFFRLFSFNLFYTLFFSRLYTAIFSPFFFSSSSTPRLIGSRFSSRFPSLPYFSFLRDALFWMKPALPDAEPGFIPSKAQNSYPRPRLQLWSMLLFLASI